MGMQRQVVQKDMKIFEKKNIYINISPYNTLLYNTVGYNTVQYSMVQHSTVQYLGCVLARQPPPVLPVAGSHQPQLSPGGQKCKGRLKKNYFFGWFQVFI